MSSSSSNISQSTFSTSDPETPQSTNQRIQNFDQSLNHVDLEHSIEQSIKNAQKEMHQKRIQNLRKELDYLKNTEWKYEFENRFLHLSTREDESDEQKRIFVSDQLLQLEIDEQRSNPYKNDDVDVPNHTKCFQRNGLITYCGENYVLINGNIYYDTSNCFLSFNINDSILYLGYKDSNDHIIVVRILENQGLHWNDEFIAEEQSFEVIEHVLVSQVKSRSGRLVFIADSDLKFNLDYVEGSFIPIQGDWIEMKCSVQQNNNRASDISTNQVIKVFSFKPLRTKIKSCTITEWNGHFGTCDRQIYFNKDAVQNCVQPQIGHQAMIEAIESNQGLCTWRALEVVLDVTNNLNKDVVTVKTDEQSECLQMEKERQIDITYPLKFDGLNMKQSKILHLNICNNSRELYILYKWIVLNKKKNSQINIKPVLVSPVKICPGDTFSLTIECNPKFYGNAKELIVLLFKGFQIKRFVEINVNNDHCTATHLNYNNSIGQLKKIENMQRIRENSLNFVPGVKLWKSPHFISIKIGVFPIPTKYWSAVLGDSNQEINSCDYTKILHRMQTNIPCLTQNLNIFNYIDKWHSFLYMEEIQENLNMRSYDKNNVFLSKHQDCLGIEIPGLAEKRPSLIKGDRVLVEQVGTKEALKYEGYIHIIKGNLVLVKFSPQFHESYTGSDVSIEFHFSRTVYRREHHCINLAISNLGPSILFPSRIITSKYQVVDEQLKNIKWLNNNVNSDQKEAVVNILKGECRPMPYVIFGPPGTGKTVTIIELILQILLLLPESRILVATPSNSASNLITERLIHFKEKFSGSFVRVVANYLVESDGIPDSIKPFCATIDISAENSSKPRHMIKENINLFCQKSFIGRQRVIIGTCHTLGAMKHWDMPKGHFTHVIVDEAGQATEPEIMVPLTFIDKHNGQIILAGDPMQLGPVVISKYCFEYGMDESFLCRILRTFPYQKDKDAFDKGFDNRVVTKLNDSYRSVKEVLTLPSEMFYDGSLIAKFEMDINELTRLQNAVREIFQLSEVRHGGGIFVLGIKGLNIRAEDSPSWYNPQEASMVALTICKLYKNNVNVDEIGIITPYLAQTRYLRLLFESMGLPQPKIGTVEEFQGQERKIILISTVRSSESLLQDDVKHTLGFVKNPKRLNVAITRAQISVILFCNPHLLSKDPLWNRVIESAVLNHKYMGCDLPLELTNIAENNETFT